MADLDLLLEAEKRGILPADKQELLNEARARGLVPGSEPSPQAATLSAAEPRSMGEMALGALEASVFPPLGVSNAIKDLKTSWNGGDPQFQPMEHISPTALLTGYAQGAAFNKLPEMATIPDALAGGDPEAAIAGYRNKITQMESQSPASYYGGNLLGNLVGLPGKAFQALTAKTIPYLGKAGTALLANLGIGQASLPIEASGGDRLMQGGMDTAFGVAGQTLDGTLNALARRSQIKNALNSSQPLNMPYENTVNGSLVNARDELAVSTGTNVPLVPEQILEDPGFLNLGRSQTKAIEQNKALNEVAGKLEGEAGMPNRRMSNRTTRVETNEIAPHIDEQATTESVGSKLVEARQANDNVYQNRYSEITQELAGSKNETFVPTHLDNAVKEVMTELGKGTGVTETATLNFLQKARQEGLIGDAKPATYFKGTDTLVPPEYAGVNPSLVEVRGGPNKVSLENLYKMRKELSDIEFTSEGNNNQPLLKKMKDAIDLEMQNYGKAVNVSNPGLGNKVFKLNEDFKSDLSKFENKNVKKIINQLSPADPNNRDLVGATNTLYGAARNGDLQTIRAVEKLVGPEQTAQLKQSMIQRTLRGDTPDSYDIQGLHKRLAKLPDEAKNYYFGKQRTNYENLAEVGKYVDSAVEKFQDRHNVEGIVSMYGGKRFVVNKLLSIYNNNPIIAEMIVRQNKMTPMLGKFQATRLVETLFKLAAADNQTDLQKNFKQSE
jgi:hypothetical protein